MAAKSREADNNEIEAVDLISLLALPENADSYNQELAIPEEELDLMAIGEEALREEKAKEAEAATSGLHRLSNKPSAATMAPNWSGAASFAQNSADKRIPVVDKPASRVLVPLAGFENDSFEKIIGDISVCQRCGLCSTRKNVVPGVGNQHAKLVLIGEAPGADEDAQGIPFVGKAGQHLDKILAAAGFKKEEIYICNILKCRPPQNRDPNNDEMVVCTPFLQRQLALIKPKMIGCLGNIACHYVIGPKVPGISRLHGQWFNSIFGIPTFAMYHPSYLIRSESREKGSPNWQMWQDIRALKAKYDSLK